jgi:hypothetical protein
MRKTWMIVAVIYASMQGGTVFAKPFIDNKNDTVTDTGAQLMWQQGNAPEKKTWKDALKYCEELTLSGYSDWRLPDVKELSSLIDETKNKSPLIDACFPDTKTDDYYWSSSVYAPDTNDAWDVSFNYGYVSGSSKDNTNYVRCVRSGQ